MKSRFDNSTKSGHRLGPRSERKRLPTAAVSKAERAQFRPLCASQRAPLRTLEAEQHLLDYPVGSLSGAGGKKFDDKTGGGAKKIGSRAFHPHVI